MKIAFVISHSFDLAQALLFEQTADEHTECTFIILKHQYTDNINLSEFNTFEHIINLRDKKNKFIIGVIKNTKDIIEKTRSSTLIIAFNKFDWTQRLLSKHVPITFISQYRDNKHNKLSLNIPRTVKSNIVEFILGLPFSKVYLDPHNKNIRDIKLTDHLYEVIMTNNIENNYTAQICYPVPAVKSENKLTENLILIFGGRFLSWNYVNHDEIKSRYHDFFDYLEKKYERPYFLYMKHPLENEEFEFISDERLNCYDGNLNAELFMITNYHQISHTISIGSTSSLSAYNFGIQTSIFYPDYVNDEQVKKVYDQIFQGVNKEINSLDGVKCTNLNGATLPDLVDIISKSSQNRK